MKIYNFTEKIDEDFDPIETLGGKGANLNRMAVELKLPVPEGFTIPCKYTFDYGKDSSGLVSSHKIAILDGMQALQRSAGRAFGNETNPLLISVRSGAPRSMPGMMETILNLGLNDQTVVGLAAQTNEQFAWDSYRRFIQMYSTVVFEMSDEPFIEHLEVAKSFSGSTTLDAETLKLVVRQFKQVVKEAGHTVPTNVHEQLFGAILAVFKSWYSDKAISYRSIENISDTLGTAVNVQRMVFGNMNDQSGTGVAFTRNPNTGAYERYGDFLVCAQGEDVVNGSHATMPLSAMKDHFPECAEQLETIMQTLEIVYKDMCDIEFTIEDGKLYMLQTRIGKRNPNASIRIAFDLYDEAIISKDEAIKRIEEVKGNQQQQDTSTFSGVIVGSGLAASPGKAIGKAVFTSERAVELSEEDTILIRTETSPNDVAGMAAAKGILTAKGGLVSHAAVVARGWGKPCVVGCETLTVGLYAARIGDKEIKEGDIVCIDGTTGEIFMKG